MVSKEDRKAYEAGQKEAEFISENPIPFALGGGIESRPSDSAEAAAYDKGLKGEQLDEDKGSSGGCYLTTSCVEAMKFHDNCLELNVLRDFRDKILMPDSSGRRAVREYYAMAPEIVLAVEEQENAQKIWQSTYSDIKRAVSLILEGNFREAFTHYQQMTLRFKENYLEGKVQESTGYVHQQWFA